MRIGILSDTHDNLVTLRQAVDIFLEREVEHVVHGGDFIAPFTFRELGRLNCPFTGVFGNNDGERFGLRAASAKVGEIHERLAVLELGGRRIAVMHEPDYLDDVAASGRFEVAVYGHTHQHDIRDADTLVINPGECCGWVNGRATVVVLDLSALRPEIIELEMPAVV